ncbi:MAG: XkdF-like putative serine protease domain-containing protein [Candidatus Syntrophosphaera sp.]|nr:XkdF-like putative serine protease domain-containing protein [Candidatus Syntrophosphaera sp.]
MKLLRKRVRKGELRNVEVDLISLLFDDMKPANQRGAVIKSADGRAYRTIGATAKKFKAETVGNEGLLYVTVMEPDTIDAQGDTYTTEEVKKAAYHFAKQGLVGRNDVNHNNQPVPEFVIAESYILKAEDAAHFPNSKVGSWVAVLKCEDLSSPLWQKVQKGQFNGVSIAGMAEDSGNLRNAALVAELKGQLEDIRKSLGANPSADSAKVVESLEKRINELENADENAATKELIKSFTSEVKELSMQIRKAISAKIQGEPGDGAAIDREVIVDGNKVLVKASKIELYKGIADVDSGAAMNILTANTTSLFIDEVVGGLDDDTLNDITVVPLIKDEKIDAGVIADLVLTNALDTPASAQAVGTADITCTTGILTGEFSLGRDVVEFYKDKYGDAAFGAYVEQHIAKKTSKALRKLLFSGNRDASPGVLKALNGVIQLATEASPTAVTAIDTELYPLYADRFEAALLAFSADVLEEQSNFVFYISHHDEIRLRAELARRETGAGDRFLLEGGKVFFGGIPVKPRYMPDNYMIVGLPKFIILGYRTDAELKVEHHGSDWKFHWYIRVRPGITYVDGFVKVFLAADGS